jgi:hypothetical protein
MKDWQKGYPLEDLVEIQDFSFKNFNKKVLNPFLVMKKNRVAEALDKGELFLTPSKTAGIHYSKLKVGGKISMFTGYRIPILEKKAGDVIIKRISPSSEIQEEGRMYENSHLKAFIDTLTSESNVYMYVVDECLKSHEIADNCNFTIVGKQYNTFADVISIYYKGDRRDKIKQPHGEYLTLSKMKTKSLNKYIKTIQMVLNRLEKNKIIDFTNHYSNYNNKNTWSAISLRGYSPDWRFIEKPDEMNEKWLKENEDKDFFLQDTDLMDYFNNDNSDMGGGNIIYSMLNQIGVSTEPYRIRFMKLKGGEGTLGRHTDQVCPDTGIADGKLMRLHFPIFTNDKVKFKCWHSRNYDEAVMKQGECWYLDTRKPHEATNGGDDDRIHLVIDVPANKELRKMFQ